MNCECALCKNDIPFELPHDIVNSAKNGDLVLFCGAGVSTESKTVLPYSFYTSISEELKNDNDDCSFSELMQIYCDKPNGRRKLLNNIRERFDYIKSFPELERQATSFHRELSELYMIKTIITTNWDTFFEDYCAAVPITIPEDFVFLDDKSRFVLKIHGSIQNLSSIIATKDDYDKCYKSLQNGIMGAKLKTILAEKTVVFIGFSFGDDDFEQIFSYLREEMGEIYPHIYIVTIDQNLETKLNYKNSTFIVTSGQNFIHQLKNALIEQNLIKNCNISPIVEMALNKVETSHRKVSEIDLKANPSAIYTLAYQDGIIHSFERFFQRYNTGEYNIPSYLCRLANKYKDYINCYKEEKDYWNMAYYEGYTNGLVLLEVVEEDPEVIVHFPVLYLPNAQTELDDFETYLNELKRLKTVQDEYTKYASTKTERITSKEIVVHHPPY